MWPPMQLDTPYIGGYRSRSCSGSRSSQMLLLIVCSLAQLVSTSSQAAAAACEPLLVTIEGGSSSGGDSMATLSVQLVERVSSYVINVDNKYFFEDGLLWIPHFDNEDATRLSEYLSDIGLWPIVLIGHSLGGTTAYEIASRIPISLVVTLDAVSTPDNMQHPGNGVKWINVYAYNHWWGLGNSLGEDWQYEPNADENRVLKRTSHHAVVRMFNEAHEDVYDALRSCTRNPSRRAGLNREVMQELCEHDGISCSVGLWRGS